ncbi:hypothetical protein, variant [Aphanomyces invadans]|uniref:C2 domain-containing protein n=1 Tax=Aphanomyces invadans TaxID=157072 RepID=A0A024U0B2_9STRA|nr:hypothetical protein, variant [Aphanomyces invadans]ETV99321.1 hypothetical protein, variant [Aphanomyces invadans]|eukprot:XP_008871877.1 hypothetical protein, variant [Aphanomyces invadans]
MAEIAAEAAIDQPTVLPRQPQAVYDHAPCTNIHTTNLPRRATVAGSTVVESSRIPVLRHCPPKTHHSFNVPSNERDESNAVDSSLSMPTTTADWAILQEVLQGADPLRIECLNLGRSVSSDVKTTWKLKSLGTFSPLSQLVTLDVSGHGIYTMDGLDQLSHLKHLTMARNNLKVLKFPKPCLLESIDVSGNYITQLPKGIQHLTHLQRLNLAGNGLAVLKQIEVLAPLINLHTLNLSANPLAVLQSYRDFVVFTLLALSTLDDHLITEAQREKSRRRFTGPLPEDEIRREADRMMQLDQLELEEKQEILEAENTRLKSELLVKSQLLENKSKEWSSATHQLLQLQQDLAMLHIDRNLPDSPMRQRYSSLHGHVNHSLGHGPTQGPPGETSPEDAAAPSTGYDGDSLRLVHKVSVLRESKDTMEKERAEIVAEITAIRNEIVLLDNDIGILKQSLVGEQHAHSTSVDHERDPTYYYDDGRARLEELHTQITFADAEVQELEQRLVHKTKEMLAADLRVDPRNGRGLDKRMAQASVFDKEISALSYKLERMTTQKAEWVDELHRLQTSTQLPVLRLKEVQDACNSPRASLRKTFRICDDAPLPPETNLFRMLVSEKLAHLHALQQRRLDLVDVLMTREATHQALNDHLARIDAELAEIGDISTTEHKMDSNDPSFALTSPQDILDHLKDHVVGTHVTNVLGNKDDAATSPKRSPGRSPHRHSNDKPIAPSLNAYQHEYAILPGVDLTSANYALLSGASQLAFDANTRLLLACKKLQQAEQTNLIDATTNMDIDPATKRILSRLEVTLIAATNLPRTRRLHSTCDPYALLHLEHQNLESGQWERYHPTNALRSNTRPNTLYPMWEEEFVLKPIETMSTRLCVTIMDDKRTADRHEKLGDVKIELRTLVDQKRTVAWFLLSPAPSKGRPQPAVRLRLRFLYNKADRLRRVVDRLVAGFVAERHALPPFLYRISEQAPDKEGTKPTSSAPVVPSGAQSPRAPATSTTCSRKQQSHPPLLLDLTVEEESSDDIPPQKNSPVAATATSVIQRSDVATMEAYREIFQARKLYRKVKAKPVVGCFDRESPYHPRQVTAEAAKVAPVTFSIFKQPCHVPRDTSQAIPERYFGLTTDKSERLKELFGKMAPRTLTTTADASSTTKPWGAGEVRRIALRSRLYSQRSTTI